MLFLRSFLYYILFYGSTALFSLVLVLVGWALPFAQRCTIARGWGGFNLWALRAVCGLKVEVQGLENIPPGNGVFLVKHQSAWETMALWPLLGKPLTWVLKRELMWIPIFGWALAVMEPVAIDRKAIKKALKEVVEQGTVRLARGRWVLIFPEGTRTAPGQHGKYGGSGALLASKAGVPVVPIAHNAGVFWRRRGIAKQAGTIQLRIGPPIDTQGISAGEINRRAEEWIEAQVAALPQNP